MTAPGITFPEGCAFLGGTLIFLCMHWLAMVDYFWVKMLNSDFFLEGGGGGGEMIIFVRYLDFRCRYCWGGGGGSALNWTFLVVI